ncbi:MAG: tetratricopeptide repeat protein [Acidobacteria bacterium]|nr:tetratricopeptide repeat protein [Acidobacteriota bacterium]MBU4307153.1 tetratricopeptide repeat protein [Acidobacteriota bacterium]MBU4405461.1 tetratricopeptide repeat protein [Acidobacteriota bacterium]MCG2812675.1 tetratricopeptide repeat protein [Candidatus Aminicenantes bacterium]
MKKVLLIVALAIFLSVSLFAQSGVSGKGKIKGIVLDESGKPLAGVTIKLFSLRSQAYFQPNPKTDSEGRWKAIYLRGGSWNIDFEKAGYETKKISYGVDETPGAKQPEIEVKLTKIEGIALTDSIVSELEKGNLLFLQKKYQEAMLAYDDILKKNPDVFIIYKNIGNCYFALEKYDRAVEFYQKLFEKQPKSAEIMTLIGNSYVNAKNMEKAMEWYGKIPFEEIKDADTLYNIGANLTNNNKNDLALKYFKRSVEVDADFAEGYYQLGMTHTALNQIPEALKALKKFMELAPDSPNLGTAKAIIDAFSKVK